jgi:diguanylate cyclase (GGDEF)-like protein
MQLTNLRHLSAHPSRVESPHSRTTAALILAAAMAMVFALDRLTGVPHVQHLYYFPIILAAVMLGTPGGAGAATTAIVLYHLANPHALSWRYEEADVVQMAVFVAVGLAAARLANDARKLHRLAMTDDLTGLHNLRSFELALKGMMRAARTTRTPLSLMVLDVDRLKSINDQHGHLAGAEAVRTVGHLIAAVIPAPGVACRYGGDEFVVALPIAAAEARQVADDLRRTVLAQAPALAGVQFPRRTLSVSIGLASRPQDEAWTMTHPVKDENEESEALFRAADEALYLAKNGGRNRVHAAVLRPGPAHRASAR